MLTSTEILHFLKQNKQFFKENYGCLKIGLFGSYARNEQTNESDIDILVLYEPNTKNLYEKEIALKTFIYERFNKKVDICSEKWIKPIFKELVIKETIYA